MRSNSKTQKKIIRFVEKVNNGYIYRYSLYMGESFMVASYKLPLYSITVELTDKDGAVSSADTKEIFADVGKAFSFFDMLVRNLATPIDLAYIVEDAISL